MIIIFLSKSYNNPLKSYGSQIFMTYLTFSHKYLDGDLNTIDELGSRL